MRGRNHVPMLICGGPGRAVAQILCAYVEGFDGGARAPFESALTMLAFSVDDGGQSRKIGFDQRSQLRTRETGKAETELRMITQRGTIDSRRDRRTTATCGNLDRTVDINAWIYPKLSH